MNTNFIKSEVRKIILSTQKDKEGSCVIYVEVLRIDTKKYKRINTLARVLPTNWSKKKQEVLKGDGEYFTKNQSVAEIYNKILKYTLELTNLDYRQTIEREYPKLRELYPEIQTARTKYLTDYFQEYIDLRKANRAPVGTWKEFVTVKNRLIGFEGHKGKRLNFIDMNLTFADEFSIWMNSTMKYNSGTVEKSFTILKTVLFHFEERQKELGIVVPDIFKSKNFKRGKKSVNDANPLSFEEFQALAKYDFNTDVRMQRTKDSFIFQCSTGLRFSDMDKVRPEMIIDGRIRIEPQKTQDTKKDNVLYIDLNEYSAAILEKYAYDTSSFKITNQKYNENLKLMFESLNMPVHSSHHGRDTFVSICILRKVSVPIILSWTGQSSYSILARYIKLDDVQKKSEMIRVFNDPLKESIKHANKRVGKLKNVGSVDVTNLPEL